MTSCSLRLLPTSRGRNNLLFDIKLKSDISKCLQKNWKSSKASDLFRLTYFQFKAKRSGRCHNLANSRIPLVEFSSQTLIVELVSHVIRVFCFHRARRSLFPMVKSLLMEKSRGQKRHWVMKKEKKRRKGQRRKNEYYSVKKRRKSLMKATCTPLHAGVQVKSPSNQN